MSTLYRGGKLGDSLVEALEVLINEEKISGELATEVLNKVTATEVITTSTHLPCNSASGSYLSRFFCSLTRPCIGSSRSL